ncbi:MAG: hypothetical protein HY647_02900 [Acidobacteria bacterium]|nr:hypothetical protein [Acidobacteriota bacterium]
MESFHSYLNVGLRPSLEGDTLDLPPFWADEISEIDPLLTLVAGKVVYEVEVGLK